MIGRILPVILLFLLVNNTYAAEKAVVFKALHKDKYEVYLSTQNDYETDPSLLGSISRQLLRVSFQVDKIPTKYYTIKKTDNISFFGFDITQYIITPKNDGRFKHILWLDNDSNIIKLEVYNNLNKLMLAFSGFDFMSGAIYDPYHKDMIKELDKDMHKDKPKNKPEGMSEDIAGYDIDRPIDNKSINKSSGNVSKSIKGKKGEKYKFWDADEFYKGFRHIHTTAFERNIFDLSFEDGINRFSMFIKPIRQELESVSSVVYGNYLFTRVIDNMEYAVYGTVSFGFMEEIINLIHKNLDKITEIVYEGKVLTSEVYMSKE